MLLRIIPILSSLLPYSKESSPESELIIKLPRIISVLTLSQICPKKKNHLPCSKVLKNKQGSKIKERDEVKDPQQKTCMQAKLSIQEPFSRTGLHKGVPDHEECDDGGKKDIRLHTSVMVGNGNGKGSDDGHGKGWDFPEEDNGGRDRMDAYYHTMIEANPSDALLLGNYAKFLKEVRGDHAKAVEYLERAILADPGDGHILSLYADLIWQTEKNADRAKAYFDQAIKSAPDDCYVMASYAKFLWDTE